MILSYLLTRTLYALPISSVRATCPAYIIPFVLISIMPAEEYVLWRYYAIRSILLLFYFSRVYIFSPRQASFQSTRLETAYSQSPYIFQLLLLKSYRFEFCDHVPPLIGDKHIKEKRRFQENADIHPWNIWALSSQFLCSMASYLSPSYASVSVIRLQAYLT
jgi:hypothetical protein